MARTLSQQELEQLNQSLELLEKLTTLRQQKYDYAKSSDGTLVLEFYSPHTPYFSLGDGSEFFVRANYGCGSKKDFSSLAELLQFLEQQLAEDEAAEVEGLYEY